MNEFYLHGSRKVSGAAKHFALIVKAESKDEAIKMFIEQHGKDVYLHEIHQVNIELPTKID